MRSALVRAVQVVLGLATGLAVAEGAFWWRDDGAFPHVNVYEPDDVLGVRLRPYAAQRFKYADNPTTSIRVNGAGFRGDDWGEPVPGEIVVVGDSQVFGLGVEEGEAMPARLAALRGVPVRNAGVPTYGPQEYLAVVDRLLAERKPAVVVLELSFANDPFELARPNRDRHAVYDGWAVRRETMPDGVVAFPGRSWLFSRSHLVYALRQWLYDPPADATAGLPSEGTWDEALAAAKDEATPDASADAAGLALDVRATADARRQYEIDLADTWWSLPDIDAGDPFDADAGLRAVRQRAAVGDVVRADLGEESERRVEVTAELLRRGAQLRAGMEPALRDWLKTHPDDARAPKVRELLDRKADLDARLSKLSTETAGDAGPRSPLAGTVAKAAEACRKAGAELVVVALPLDVQVSADEWKKYGAEPRDMTATRVLLTDLVDDAKAMGVRAVDPTDALAAAEPDVFVHADLHLSPKGQQVVAEAVSAALDRPAPPRKPGAGLAPGRSRVPTASEWEVAPENSVRGSTTDHCTTRDVREWLRVTCTARTAGDDPTLPALVPRGVVVTDGPLEAMAHAEPGQLADLVVPMMPGRDVTATFAWKDHTDELRVQWTDGRRTMALVRVPRRDVPTPTAAEARLTACLEDRVEDVGYRRVDDDPHYHAVETRFGDPTGCDVDDCDALIACAQGARIELPACGDGEVNAGSSGACRTACDDAHPCERGVCTDWNGTGVCL